jgi:hypothetical protein
LAFPEIKRHRYFHHLNSSQAFALNLFFPYFSVRPDQSPSLLRALGQTSALLSWKPEAIPDPDEGTNIDVLWKTMDGVTTLCEVKLSESEFGKANNDSEHRQKFETIYRDVLAKHMLTGTIEFDELCDGYQFYRNVWHMVGAAQNRLVFLLPRGNAPLWRQLEAVRGRLTTPTLQRISTVAIEDVITSICSASEAAAEMREYANKIKRKYVF